MRERVAARLPLQAFHYLDGTADPEAEARRYAALLAAHPLDLCCAGIGENGHLAFNDPPVADFDDPHDVKVIALEEASRRQQVGEGHFATIDDVPTHAITVTIPALLRRGASSSSFPRRGRPRPCGRRWSRRSRPRARRRSSAPNRTPRSISTPNQPRSSARDLSDVRTGPAEDCIPR